MVLKVPILEILHSCIGNRIMAYYVVEQIPLVCWKTGGVIKIMKLTPYMNTTIHVAPLTKIVLSTIRVNCSSLVFPISILIGSD